MSALTIYRKKVKESAAKIKRNMKLMNKAAEDSGIRDKFGVNGPAGKYSLDFVFPDAEDDSLLPLVSSGDTKVDNFRKALKHYYKTSSTTNSTVTSRLESTGKALGGKDLRESLNTLWSSVSEMGDEESIDDFLKGLEKKDGK